ncbi:MAG: squalene/phytoene synthase family protein [Gemmataceae bacterium]|nr:squalene/phytoene synthase family protein [Gemmataceae bacterium]
MGHSSFGGTAKSYRYCHHVTTTAGSSFPLAFRLLPAARRRAMDALYAFLRVTDDLADAPGDPAVKRGELARWRAALGDALAGRYSHPVHPALHDAVRRYDIPPQYLSDVLDGVESDLSPVRFATFADLHPYCYRVASAVGLACVRVWGLRPGATWADAEGPAVDAGIAFQLTNVLRDLGEDAARGRVYLPEDELARFGVTPGAGGTGHSPGGLCHPAGVGDLLRLQVGRARGLYRRAAGLDRLLTDPGRAIFRVMRGTYEALLDEVERRGPAGLAGRARVPRRRKGLIFLGAWPVRWGLW